MRNIKCAVNVRAHFNCARPIKWAASKKYKMTKLTGNSFHGTATLKIASDSIPIDLAVKLAPCLEPINFNPWAQLEFKDELTGAEMEEKQALEEKNMAVIERLYQRLRDDKEIQGRIRQIKAHPWVRVVERQ